MPVALHLGDPKEEASQAMSLGLADASALPRVVVKGPGATVWLKGRDIPVPDAIYDVALGPANDGYQVIRTGAEEIFVEDGWKSELVARISHGLRASPGPIEVVRQDACFL